MSEKNRKWQKTLISKTIVLSTSWIPREKMGSSVKEKRPGDNVLLILFFNFSQSFWMKFKSVRLYSKIISFIFWAKQCFLNTTWAMFVLRLAEVSHTHSHKHLLDATELSSKGEYISLFFPSGRWECQCLKFYILNIK